MAVVREGITSGGVRYRIMDDAYAGVGPEELERRRRHACEAAYRILADCARREAGKREENHEARDLRPEGNPEDCP